MSDPGELAQALAELAKLAGTSDKLDEALERVVEVGLRVTGASFGSVTLVDGELLHTMAARDSLSLRIDEIQQETGEGPCLSATERHSMHYLGDTIRDTTWPDFSQRTLELGLRSVLAFSLWPQHELLGALNFYSRTPNAFMPEQQDIGAILAAQAGALIMLDKAKRAVNLEHRLAAAETEQEHLKKAIETRDVIATAKGILAEREGVSPEQAFDLLRKASQHLNEKLRDVAKEVVEEERRRQQ